MTNDEIKTELLRLSPCRTDFSVIMTGKKSSRVNGLYRPETHEILLHNRNFSSDNSLVYTAVHEYTHHLMNERNPEEQRKKPHGRDFWALDAELLDKACELGIYSRKRSQRMEELLSRAREADRRIAELQVELGKTLSAIRSLCAEEDARYEDVVEHDLQMKRRTAETAVKTESALRSLGAGAKFGQDVQGIIAKARFGKDDGSGSSHAEAVHAAEAAAGGKSLSQIEPPEPGSAAEESERENLIKEKARIERTVGVLNCRLKKITLLLSGLNAEADEQGKR